MLKQLFLTGCIRSGTNWVFDILSEHYRDHHSEYFDYLDLEKRKTAFGGNDSLLFKINEDMRNICSLSSSFPDAKIVIMVRNPLEVLHSIYNPSRESLPYRPFHDLESKWSRAGDEDRLPAAIRRLESYFPSEALDVIAKPTLRFHILRYEDLLARFNSTLSLLFDFCEINEKERKTFCKKPLETANQGIRLQDFSAEHQKIISLTKIPFLSQFMGYSNM